MSLALTYNSNLTCTETIGQNVGSAPALTNTIKHSAFDKQKILSGATGQPVSRWAAFVATLVAGALNIDLTLLTGTNAGLIDGTGLKLQFLRIENLGANLMTLATGGANGYVVGAGLVIPPGGCLLLDFNAGSTIVDATHKILALTGTGAQTANVTVVVG